jgi:hypothetical protein
MLVLDAGTVCGTRDAGLGNLLMLHCLMYDRAIWFGMTRRSQSGTEIPSLQCSNDYYLLASPSLKEEYSEDRLYVHERLAWGAVGEQGMNLLQL